MKRRHVEGARSGCTWPARHAGDLFAEERIQMGWLVQKGVSTVAMMCFCSFWQYDVASGFSISPRLICSLFLIRWAGVFPMIVKHCGGYSPSSIWFFYHWSPGSWSNSCTWRRFRMNLSRASCDLWTTSWKRFLRTIWIRRWYLLLFNWSYTWTSARTTWFRCPYLR